MDRSWFHVIVNTRCSWLPGDPRGFRNRAHGIHSSGDYKNPPPRGEHANLHRYFKDRSGIPVAFDLDLRMRIVSAFIAKLQAIRDRPIACACGAKHPHCVVELSNNYTEMKRAIGKAKQKASHAIRDALPGTLWAAGGEFQHIRDAGHFKNAYAYVRTKQARSSGRIDRMKIGLQTNRWERW